jgi:5-formyltetrahydrofolate cyclo-ligase
MMEQGDVHQIRKTIRERIIKDRDALSPELRHPWSEAIVDRLRHYLSRKPTRSIHCFISFRSEVETHDFIEQALREGTHITVPVVERDGDRQFLGHAEIRDLSSLVLGPFGVQEPRGHMPASLDELDAIIVPLVAFDRHGTRLGYGKGFYDAFLRELPRSIERIGLAFSMQEIDHIPLLSHDEPLDTIVTEQEIIHVHS